jgi:outer membrane protein assembly factor BamB
MPLSWSKILLSIAVSSLLFVACKKEYSSDDALPVTYSPSIVLGSNNQVLYGVNPQNGQKNWELGLSFPVKASPVLYKGSIYLASSYRDSVLKINAKTGVVTKKIAYGAGIGATATPIADGSLLYVASMAGFLYAIDTGTGNVKWSYGADGPIESSPTIANGNIYFASTTGTIYCLEKTNGTTTSPGAPTPTWSLNIPGAKFVSSPSVAAPYLFVGSMTDSAMYCVYLDAPGPTGVLRWKYKTRGGIRSSPATVGGTCIFGANDFRVYCLDTTIDPLNGIYTPDARWIDSLSSEVTSSPFVSGQTVYVGCKDYKLYALRIINGSVKWNFASSGIITSSPLVYNGTVYVGSYDRNLYALDTTRGTIKWKYSIDGQIECSPVIDDFSKLTGYNSQISGFTN